MRSFFERYKHCVLRIVIRTPKGDPGIGTGFHIGGGLILTAGHVLKNNEILEVATDQGQQVKVERAHLAPPEFGDLAVLETSFDLRDRFENVTYGISQGQDGKSTRVPAMEVHAEYVPLGGHLDDWISDGLMLSECLLLGFPRIPLSRRADLVALSVQVNAIIDRYDATGVHFIVSGVPRGGFSGGPVIHSADFVLGVVTESLVHDHAQTESGFQAVLSVEPILGFMASRGLRPLGVPDEIWSLFDSSDRAAK